MLTIKKQLCVFLSVLILSASALAQHDWKTAVSTRLAKYEPAKMSSDKTTLITPGTVFLLKKDGLVLVKALEGRHYLMEHGVNIFSGGILKPEFPSIARVNVEQGVSRSFKAGENLMITKAGFTAKGNGIEFEIVSDRFDGARYFGTLRILPAKGAEPDGNALLRDIDEVIEATDSGTDSLCRGLIKLTTTLPIESVDKTFIPGASLPATGRKNDFQYHTEDFFLQGDQVNQIHSNIQSCLKNFKVDTPLAKKDMGWTSLLVGSDPPYDTALSIVSSRTQGHTAVSIQFSRIENVTQQKLDFAKIAFVWTAASTCGWPIAKGQNDTFARFTGLWFNQEVGLAKAHINQKGRLDFCDDTAERAKYNRLQPTIWPLGMVGKP